MATATLPRHRKIKLVLAAFVVLGVGAAATSAVWSDDVFFQGTAATDSFNLQGSTTSADDGFVESNDGTDIELTFDEVTLVPGTPQTVTGWILNDGDVDATLTAPVPDLVTNPFGDDLDVTVGAYSATGPLAPGDTVSFTVTLTLDEATPVALSGQSADFTVQVTGTSA